MALLGERRVHRRSEDQSLQDDQSCSDARDNRVRREHPARPELDHFGYVGFDDLLRQLPRKKSHSMLRNCNKKRIGGETPIAARDDDGRSDRRRIQRKRHLDYVMTAQLWPPAADSHRQLEEMTEERGVDVDHSTLNRWVVKYAPLLDKQFRAGKRAVGSSWRLDETYVKVKGCWKYLYRAVHKAGATVDFLLTAKRACKAALHFLRKAIDRSAWRAGEDHDRQERRQYGGDRKLR